MVAACACSMLTLMECMRAWQHHLTDVQVRSGLMTAQDFVRVTSTAVAQAFNIYPRKGTIAAGSDADVIIFDPTLRHTISVGKHHSRMDTNVYEGWQITGKVHIWPQVFKGKQLVCNNRQCVAHTDCSDTMV